MSVCLGPFEIYNCSDVICVHTSHPEKCWWLEHTAVVRRTGAPRSEHRRWVRCSYVELYNVRRCVICVQPPMLG
jgi:hypothetical protein